MADRRGFGDSFARGPSASSGTADARRREPKPADARAAAAQQSRDPESNEEA